MGLLWSRRDGGDYSTALSSCKRPVLIQVKDFLQDQHSLVRTSSFRALEKWSHLRLPAEINLSNRHSVEGFLKIVGLQVAKEQSVLTQEQAVVLPTGLPQRLEHVRPDLAMALAILRNPVFLDLKAESDAWHGVSSRHVARVRI